MPEYVKQVLDRLQHPRPNRPQYAPHLCTVDSYGKILQMETDIDNIKLLVKKTTQRIHYIVGNTLYYARSVNPTIL